MPRPASIEEASAIVAELAADGRSLRPRGGGTKLEWGGGGPADAVELDTRGLRAVVDHQEGDFTAAFEAGLPLAAVQAHVARAGQMLALDPPLGRGDAATIGGVVAAADAGPLRHRYGGPRDLLLGMTIVLSDGTVARPGSNVIKNVAGYDVTKLFAGSFGTLGLIAAVTVRLHPLPAARATAIGESAEPERLAAAARTLAGLPLEAESLDVAWADGRGALIVRFGGGAAARQAADAAERLGALEDVAVVEDDDALWARQRARQRAPEGGAIVKAAVLPSDLALVLRAAHAHGATVAARAAVGVAWLALPSAQEIAALRRSLAPRACTVLDGAAHVGDPWPPVDPGALALMRRLKRRFDPARAFRPGAYVGGL